MTTFSQDSAHTLVVTEESFPLSVPTSLLRLISPTLSSVLSLPPCLTTAIIIPDTNKRTLSVLLELLQTGASSQQVSTESVEELAKILDIPGFCLTPRPHDTADISEEVIIPDPNIKVGDDECFSCELCFKSFNSQLPLSFHYCKHFYAELQRLEMSNIVDRQRSQRCKKCQKDFPTQKALVCHVGVRHSLLNKVLRSKGIQEIDLGPAVGEENEDSSFVDITEDTTETAVKANITKITDSAEEKSSENEERLCGVCSEDFSRESLSALVLHYCDHFSEHLPYKFRRFYSGNSCSICNKVFSVQASLLSHIGVRHTKINNVLRDFNIPAIHFPKKQMVLRSKVTAVNPVVPNENLPKIEEPEDVKNIKVSKFHCMVCGKGDDFLQNLGVHMANIHFNQELKQLMGPGNSCSICGKTFKKKQMAISHIGMSHGNLDQLLEKKGFSSFSSLKSRKSVGTEVVDVAVPRRKTKTKRCQLCGKEEENLSLLKLHLVLKHFLSDIKKRYKSLYDDGACGLCSKPYPSTSIWQHIGAVHNKLDEILLENGLTPFNSPQVTMGTGEEHLIKTEPETTMDPLEEISSHETDYHDFENMFVEILQ